jgi:hypothetical protein
MSLYAVTQYGAEHRVDTTDTWAYTDYVSSSMYGAYNGNTSGSADAAVIADAAGGVSGIPCGGVNYENYQEVDHSATGGLKGGLGGPVTSVTISPSAAIYDVSVGPTPCGVSWTVPRVTSESVSAPPATSVTSDKGARSVETYTVYGAGDPVDLLDGSSKNVRDYIHPQKAPLAFWYSQGAFDPTNYATHGKGVNSAAVVKIGDETYDVKHQLFGWVGIA